MTYTINDYRCEVQHKTLLGEMQSLTIWIRAFSKEDAESSCQRRGYEPLSVKLGRQK